jgi:HSP20 family protein
MATNKEGLSGTSAGSSGRRSEGGRQELTRGTGGRGSQHIDIFQPYFPAAADFFGNPFAAMRRMHDEMDRIFSSAFSGTGGGMLSSGRSTSGEGTAWSPAIEVKQQGGRMTVCAELPGLKPEEVNVEIGDDALVIQGERRQEETSDQGGVHRTERRYGRFYRAIPLPEGAQAEQAKAEFRNGVLEIDIPLPEPKSQRRQIPISAGAQAAGTATHKAEKPEGQGSGS